MLTQNGRMRFLWKQVLITLTKASVQGIIKECSLHKNMIGVVINVYS